MSIEALEQKIAELEAKVQKQDQMLETFIKEAIPDQLAELVKATNEAAAKLMEQHTDGIKKLLNAPEFAALVTQRVLQNLQAIDQLTPDQLRVEYGDQATQPDSVQVTRSSVDGTYKFQQADGLEIVVPEEVRVVLTSTFEAQNLENDRVYWGAIYIDNTPVDDAPAEAAPVEGAPDIGHVNAFSPDQEPGQPAEAPVAEAELERRDLNDTGLPTQH